MDYGERTREAMFLAAAQGDLEGLKKALENGAKAGDLSETGYCALMKAAEGGHEGCVRLLLQEAPDQVHRRARGREKMSSLMLAAFQGHAGCVQALLEADATQAFARDALGRTALMWAARSGREGGECVELLLKASDGEALDQGGQSALSHACGLLPDPQAMRLLAGSKMAWVADKDGDFPMALAATCGNLQALRSMLEAQPDLGWGAPGEQALSAAAARGKRECVEALLPMSSPRAARAAAQTAKRWGEDEVAGLLEAFALAREELAMLGDLAPAPARANARAL